MHVEGVEGGWLSHPFWRERFVIRSPGDLMRVRNGGTDLFINPARGTRPVAATNSALSTRAASPTLRKPMTVSALAADKARSRPPKMPSRVSSPPVFDPIDKKEAVALAKRSTKVISDVFEDCRRGHPVVLPQIQSVVQDIANTLDKNSAAFATVTRLKEKDGYTYTHSIAVCALMITLGRAMELTSREVFDLGIAGMLHDIGKLSIDPGIISKAGPLDAEERAQIMLHPTAGHRVLSAQTNVPPVALDVCLHHHERLDGTGYPFGLAEDQLTTAVRIAIICDVYDAMTSNRPYKKGKSPTDAIAEMESLAGTIDQDLLFKFMRGMGVFPIGKLVRLRSNRLAIIMPTTASNSLPVARAFYNIVDDHFIDYDDVVISNSFADDQIISPAQVPHLAGDDWPAIKDMILAGKSWRAKAGVGATG